jgi:hypothetical protein
LDNDIDKKTGHMRTGRVFRGVHLEKLFKKNYGEEGFYSGEEVDLIDEEHLEPTRIEEGEAKEICQSKPDTSRTVWTTKVSNINLPIVSTVLSGQNSQNHQSPQSTVTGSLASTQKRSLVSSMEDEMRIPIFRGDGSEYLDQHWFLCEAIWNIKSITDESIKRTQFNITLRDRALRWYMKLVQGLAQPKSLNEIHNVLIA